MVDTIYQDRILASFYDAFNTDERDHDFYLALARSKPIRMLDLGCGTGTFACRAAIAGHEMTGLDPAAGMLEVAQSRPDSHRVCWIAADARDFAIDRAFDLIVMSGHAFQVFLTDADIRRLLSSVAAHLAPGGRFAFESRNPLMRAWETWTPEASREQASIAPYGRIEAFYRFVSIDHELVIFETHYTFQDGSERVSPSTLRFPSQK